MTASCVVLEEKKPTTDFYILPGFGTLPEKFVVIEESKALFARAQDGQGFALVAWKSKDKESKEDIILIGLVPAFNKDDGKERADREGKPIPYVASEERIGTNTGIIHERAVQYLKDNKFMDADLERKYMFGGGIFKGDENILLSQFRNKSANLNQESICYNRELLLALYFVSANYVFEDYVAEISADNPLDPFYHLYHEYFIRRQLPEDISREIFLAMNQLPHAAETELKCSRYITKIDDENWWTEAAHDLVQKNKKLMRTICMAAERMADPSLVIEILGYINKNIAMMTSNIHEQRNIRFALLNTKFDGDTALIAAIKKPYQDKLTVRYSPNVVQVLLEAGVSLLEKNALGMTALMVALQIGDKEIIEQLLAECMRLLKQAEEEKNSDMIANISRELLCFAIEKQDVAEVNHLLSKRVKLNLAEAISAAHKGNVEGIEDIISRQKFRFDITEIISAANAGNVEILNSLLGAYPGDLKTFINLEDPLEHVMPLEVAVIANHRDCVVALIKAGAAIDKVNNTTHWGLLHTAVLFGHVDMVSLLIKAGCHINAKDASGRTPVYIAGKKKRDEGNISIDSDVACLAVLLEAGADPNHAAMNSGWGPAHSAVWYNDVKLAHVLAKFHADFHIKNYYFVVEDKRILQSPISMAIENKRWKIAAVIFANVSPVNKGKLTVAELVILKKNRIKLTIGFIKYAKTLPVDERRQLVNNVINKKNLLSIILYKPRNAIKSFFAAENVAGQRMPKKIKMIVDEFKDILREPAAPEHKSESKAERSFANR